MTLPGLLLHDSLSRARSTVTEYHLHPSFMIDLIDIRACTGTFEAQQYYAFFFSRLVMLRRVRVMYDWLAANK